MLSPYECTKLTSSFLCVFKCGVFSGTFRCFFFQCGNRYAVNCVNVFFVMLTLNRDRTRLAKQIHTRAETFKRVRIHVRTQIPNEKRIKQSTRYEKIASTSIQTRQTHIRLCLYDGTVFVYNLSQHTILLKLAQSICQNKSVCSRLLWWLVRQWQRRRRRQRRASSSPFSFS